MFDDLAANYQHNVVASFTAYRDINKRKVTGQSCDLVSATRAANALFHFREFLPKEKALTRKDVEDLCQDFGLLGDIANVSKHKELDGGTPHGEPLLRTAEALSEKILHIIYEDEEGEYSLVQKVVSVKLSDGTERDVLEILTNVLNFWEQYLFSIGILKKARTFLYEPPVRARTRAEVNELGGIQLALEITRGVRLRQTGLLLRYNNKTGKAEPVDLTGAKAEFCIFRLPPLSFDVSLILKESGKRYSTTVVLSSEESFNIRSLKEEKERQAFLSRLPSIQAAYRQLALEAGVLKEQNVEGISTQ